MPSYRVNVLRKPPRRRDICSGLAGKLDVSIIVAENSYLHVGQGQEVLVKVDEKGLSELRAAPSPKEIERYVSFLGGVAPFSKVSGKPVIPGGTIKGNIRTRLELSFKSKNRAVHTCLLRTSRPMDKPEPPGATGWRHQRIWRHILREDRAPCNFLAEQKVCLICDLFGSAGLASLINFSDFPLADGADRMEIVDLPFGMRLEAAKPGSIFQGSVTFRNLTAEELGLLFIGMGLRNGRISNMVLLGRLKYCGVKAPSGEVFGRVHYRIDGLTLSRLSSESITLGGSEIKPGENLADEKAIDSLVKDLVNTSLRKFGEELYLVEEVRVVEKLQRT